ncbi:hypothetical protein KHA94_17645 [Bacillus sp. FJAT-49705]|uniref:DUF5643 domain-containing protein n=1 Tax=Cytobacillus citreus TaxID=2833586 RepID=A0ABS5NW19_9BACI|nr:DUF5643 domain-containing protein [Cytobacillus citreus]MBS4191992.1 hypothetical protein [Cytobacillus citreus]
MTSSEFSEADLDNVKVNWEIGSITIPENDKEIKGDWDFAFSIDATESKSSLIGQSVKEKGVQVNIEKISVTPVSFVMYYDQVVSEEIRNKWQGTYVDLEIKDDLGNVYTGEGNGGSGKDGYYMSWSKTFEKLNPNATKLIVTPHVTNYSSENQTSMEMTKDGPKEVKLPEKPGKGQEEFVLEDIIIELKK